MSPAAAAKPAPVETEALTLMLGDRVLLDRATLRVERGQVLAVTGGAGSGKTALLAVLAGQLPTGGSAELHVAGSARVDGHLLIAQGGRLAPRRPLALQVAEVVGHHLGLDLRSALRRTADGLDRMGVPPAARRFDLPPEQLPDSLRWACLFAMAAAVGPAVLLADAPAAGLDPTVRIRDLTPLLAASAHSDLGMMSHALKRLDIWSLLYADVLHIRPTMGALRFLDLTRRYIRHHLDRGLPVWFLDQAALAAVHLAGFTTEAAPRLTVYPADIHSSTVMV
ncbi:ATP-binding cassette domain-containing protein, partial [Azospirillum sp. B506]|uniref:ATP-binding cassette domain-containing protein n=1 Tax=Azospirillum sp. B506 TaxID=137721 RepID=UPI001FCBB568